ncbi:MAG TPA: hypothetical protein VFE36_16850 [Candidatus Baltobacteraceae bacterium]|nr:hypothetical protein [Candidatus Baltobacteraceae bacterium]
MEQGIANDASLSYAWRDQLGGNPQQRDQSRIGVYQAVKSDQAYAEKYPNNPEGAGYDVNMDEWANINILRPLGLPDDK